MKIAKETIKIYDGEISYSERIRIYNTCTKSFFRIGWRDLPCSETEFLHSKWDIRDWERENILKDLKNPELISLIRGRTPSLVVVNLGTPHDIYWAHTHDTRDVLLYQANLDWSPEFFGETLFYSEDLSEIIFANQYTPGRILWFDGCIPHSIRPSSRAAPYYRYTISVFYEKGD